MNANRPSRPGKHYFRCPTCVKAFAIEIAAEVPVTHVVRHARGGRLHLFRKRNLLKDECIELRLGDNTIGQYSDTCPSDIMLNDEYVSRRSVSIVCEIDSSGSYSYEFILVRSTNPASYNDSVIPVGTSRFMKDGDVFSIGKTTFYVKQIYNTK